MFRAHRKGLSFRKQRVKPNFRAAIPVFLWVLQIALMLVLANYTVVFWLQSTNMVGDAMESTLEDEDMVLVNQFRYLTKEPERGDVIAFLPNGNVKSHYYIRRIVGIPGDSVWIIDGILYINGEVFDAITENEKIEVAGIAEDEVILGADEYFVVGDHINASEDSRHANIGMVKKEEMLGKIWFCVHPFSNFGFVE